MFLSSFFLVSFSASALERCLSPGTNYQGSARAATGDQEGYRDLIYVGEINTSEHDRLTVSQVNRAGDIHNGADIYLVPTSELETVREPLPTIDRQGLTAEPYSTQNATVGPVYLLEGSQIEYRVCVHVLDALGTSPRYWWMRPFFFKYRYINDYEDWAGKQRMLEKYPGVPSIEHAALTSRFANADEGTGEFTTSTYIWGNYPVEDGSGHLVPDSSFHCQEMFLLDDGRGDYHESVRRKGLYVIDAYNPGVKTIYNYHFSGTRQVYSEHNIGEPVCQATFDTPCDMSLEQLNLASSNSGYTILAKIIPDNSGKVVTSSFCPSEIY